MWRRANCAAKRQRAKQRIAGQQPASAAGQRQIVWIAQPAVGSGTLAEYYGAHIAPLMGELSERAFQLNFVRCNPTLSADAVLQAGVPYVLPQLATAP